MKILIHDQPGHAFPIQLSVWLSQNKFNVVHVWSSSISSPRGDIHASNKKLKLINLTNQKEVKKYSFFSRLLSETIYSLKLVKLAQKEKPNIIISGNTSPAVQFLIIRHCSKNKIPFIYWLQDVYFPAAESYFSKYGRITGIFISKIIKKTEETCLQRSSHIITISDNMVEKTFSHNFKPQKSLIPNWADPSKIRAENFETSKEKFTFVYSGTLGLKHNPNLIVRLSKFWKHDKCVLIKVYTEGLGRSFLESKKSELGLNNLVLMNYSPEDKLNIEFSKASCFIALLEEASGRYSVPSKILNYMCAGKPILSSIPQFNYARRLILEQKCGLVSDPNNELDFLKNSKTLKENPLISQKMGKNGRNYAEREFDINEIGKKFEKIFSKVTHLSVRRKNV